MKDQNKNQSPKQKITSNTYVKKFETINDMIQEFKNLHPELEYIFPLEEHNLMQALCYVSDYAANTLPDIENRKYLFNSYLISANRVFVKLHCYFAFGWKLRYDKEGNVSDIEAIITTFTKAKNHDDLNEMIDIIKADANWSLVKKVM